MLRMTPCPQSFLTLQKDLDKLVNDKVVPWGFIDYEE